MSQNIGNTQDTESSRQFFTSHNISRLQNAMKQHVKKQTGKNIGNQSNEHLFQIMHHVLKEYGQHSNSRINEQVDFMNSKVLEITVPMIVEGILQYDSYVRDASQMHVPMERGQNMSIKGENPLIMKPFF
jgi:hypothetical protein